MTITRLYVALFIGSAIARLVGIPWFLLILPLLVQGLLQIVLVVAFLGSWMRRIKVAPSTVAFLRCLRVATAVGMFWLAGISFALGQAILPATLVEAVASAPAETLTVPPIVARSTQTGQANTAGSSGPEREHRSTRPR